MTEKCENLFDDVLETCYATLPSSGAFLMCAVIEMDDFCNAENLFDSPNPCDAKNNVSNYSNNRF